MIAGRVQNTDDRRRLADIMEYVMNITENPNGPCTVCKKGKRRFLTHDPDAGVVEFLCKDCYVNYVKRVTEQKEKRVSF